ncbi:hypothetical protein AUR66_05550 [Haloferax profundi]|uniref:Formyl transferase C-terminal domain-containing protein n=2 Tax=Haloferax profundi TaxID=1544718 RepID=A0A0W1SWX1_9EURY|nr:hypothetical protein AUR66_05550 [Haloferax profundi]
MFYYTTGVDAGDVIEQRSVPVEPRDTVGTVFDRLAVAACELLDVVREPLEQGAIEAMPQDLSKATYRPRRQPQDGLVDWSMSCEEISDWIRAQTHPYPGAYTFHRGTKLRIWECEVFSESATTQNPGTVVNVSSGSGFDVETGDGVVRVVRVTPDGDPSQWADEYAESSGLTQGTVLSAAEAPPEWIQTGIRPARGHNSAAFETNLTLGEQGSVDVLTRTGRPRTVGVVAELDGERIFGDHREVTGEHCCNVEYTPSTSGTHTLKVLFDVDDEVRDVRYLKLFVTERAD